MNEAGPTQPNLLTRILGTANANRLSQADQDTLFDPQAEATRAQRLAGIRQIWNSKDHSGPTGIDPQHPIQQSFIPQGSNTSNPSVLNHINSVGRRMSRRALLTAAIGWLGATAIVLEESPLFPSTLGKSIFSEDSIYDKNGSGVPKTEIQKLAAQQETQFPLGGFISEFGEGTDTAINVMRNEVWYNFCLVDIRQFGAMYPSHLKSKGEDPAKEPAIYALYMQSYIDEAYRTAPLDASRHFDPYLAMYQGIIMISSFYNQYNNGISFKDVPYKSLQQLTALHDITFQNYQVYNPLSFNNQYQRYISNPKLNR